ncbi:hypothetical protein CVT24_000654 [Panaeolus cyanescens]|uniref:G domain-containing protein n=1 Tax=Panaeolus cyanescens TaxID=181874 RepID=A0A409YY15_9AGAR|nr:hypothetical protein CVT24_000654 [Panaeolus cyanescens]
MSQEDSYGLVTTGTVRVSPRSDWSDVQAPFGVFVILLVGPTGSGKSSFIEALADNKSLGISKDQLEGFTQNVTAYHVENMMVKWRQGRGRWTQPDSPVCFLDTPGFSDTKISEMEVMDQLSTLITPKPKRLTHGSPTTFSSALSPQSQRYWHRKILESQLNKQEKYAPSPLICSAYFALHKPSTSA